MRSRERAERAPGPPVRPRDAASLVIVRGTGADAEVLMGRRAARHRFMPNVPVFPGGRVDAGDHGVGLAGDLAPGLRAWMGARWGPGRSRALGVAALRETFEEAGLVFGELADPPGTGPRRLRPDLGVLRYLGRAITPPASPIRFHARFFLARLEDARGAVRDSHELQALRWYRLDEALDLPLADVTEFLVGHLRDRLRGRAPAGTPFFSYRHGRARVRWEAPPPDSLQDLLHGNAPAPATRPDDREETTCDWD